MYKRNLLIIKDSIFFDSADNQWKSRAVSATDIDANVSNTEFGYLNGVTSAIQTQLDGKQATLTNPITGTGTNNEIAAFNSTGSTITSLSTATYPSLTEFSYVKGLTSAIQTQINALPRVVYTNYTAETTTSTSATNTLTTFTLTIADANWPLGGVLRLSGLIERTAGSGSIFMGVVCNGSTARYFSAGGQNMQWEWQIMKEAASTLRIGMGPSNTGNGSYAVHNQSTVTATASGGNYVFTFYMFVGTSWCYSINEMDERINYTMMKYMLTQNETASYYETLEEAQSAVQSPEAEIWERIDSTDNFTKVWPQ